MEQYRTPFIIGTLLCTTVLLFISSYSLLSGSPGLAIVFGLSSILLVGTSAQVYKWVFEDG